ncbi:hypothetical protein SAMN05880574_11963 [Chryseobacterium sp. RU37D]|uniref:hypothetical protein n=1 Tax=Chryseobacterium sp. RU37D TaxID=1907397 RepID=UPI0009571415|nr:hypothetical protein [Chryseobacterium sp. RU37D]SIQ65508.1 hypothetical protein SAMN05880574_11963 [Chryseobacterium sp. RU37D]
MKIEYSSITDLFQRTDSGEINLVLKNDFQNKIFEEYLKQINFYVALEISNLESEIKIYSQKVTDNTNLLQYLNDEYNNTIKEYVNSGSIIPVEFHNDYKTSNNALFRDFLLSEIIFSIVESNTIPEIEEELILLEWQHMDLLFAKELFLKEKLQYYTNSPLNNELIDNPYPNVFLKAENRLKFKEILEHLNAFDEDGKHKRGFIAKANAIFRYEKLLETKFFDKKIFALNCSVKEFVEFLNKEYHVEIEYTSKFKLSDGERYSKDVKYYYTNFL